MSIPSWVVLFVPIIAAVVSSFLSVHLAFRKTKREHRWHARYDAYTSLLRSLHDICKWASETSASHQCLPCVSTDMLTELEKRRQEAKLHLAELIEVGELLLSKESRLLLQLILLSISNEEFKLEHDSFDESEATQIIADYYGRIESIVRDRLPLIIEAARRDLE
jgi:hypothetical protein